MASRNLSLHLQNEPTLQGCRKEKVVKMVCKCRVSQTKGNVIIKGTNKPKFDSIDVLGDCFEIHEKLYCNCAIYKMS